MSIPLRKEYIELVVSSDYEDDLMLDDSYDSEDSSYDSYDIDSDDSYDLD